jgi:hypothetical protein
MKSERDVVIAKGRVTDRLTGEQPGGPKKPRFNDHGHQDVKPNNLLAQEIM